MNNISIGTFNSVKFIKLLKRRIDKYIILSKSYKTKNKKEIETNFNTIILTSKLIIKNPKIFETNSIYLVIQEFDNFHDVMKEFFNNINRINDIEVLEDRQIFFINKQKELNQFLINTNENPKIIDLSNYDDKK